MDDNLWIFDSELSDSNIHVYTIEIPEEEVQQPFLDLVHSQDVLEIYQNPAAPQEMRELPGAGPPGAGPPGAEQTTLRPTVSGFPAAAGKHKNFQIN